MATRWLKKGRGEKCSQSLSINPPSSLLEGTLKGQFFHGVCVKGALRPPPDCDGTQILIYYPRQQYLLLADLTRPVGGDGS